MTTIGVNVVSVTVRVFCVYCTEELRCETATVDHIKPLSKGGTSHRSNLILCCRVCNLWKADRDYMKFVREIDNGRRVKPKGKEPSSA